ncbi:hypothetical protein [Leuconostoc mesenteroides]|uniref:hypothetical protein n=1 Tax=Leuconostoc mesenteroides TaxID=1245 RepID=UPI00123C0021|nr:hypothetical protein [Leuconostoc mesenteroides]KAA8347283.1 hypothetical protein FE418_07290 [Leuconostoc mesenteroides]
MSENKIVARIGSFSGPSDIIKFKQKEPTRIVFNINIIGLDYSKKYTVTFMVRKKGKDVFSSTPSVFGKKQMKKINEDYVASLKIIYDAELEKSGIYDVKVNLVEIMEMNKKGGVGIIADTKTTSFVAEESC